MAKLVCHAEKYKKGSVPSIERHNERKNKNYSNEEIDPSRTQLNYDLIPRESDSYYHSVMNLVNARDNPSGKKLRKDAVVLCEFIISSSNKFFEDLSAKEQRRFFEEASRYLQNFFRKEHCIYATVHNDEHTPHMHFGFVPLTAGNRLCAKEVIDRSVLLRLQAEMPKILQGKGFQIDRGEAGSAAVHKSVKKYKADMEKEKEALTVSIQKKKQELSQIAFAKAEIKSVEQIPTGKSMFGGKITVSEKDYKKVTSLAKKQLVDESKGKKLSKEISTLRKENKSLKTENEGMKTLLNNQQSVSKRLSTAMMESELRELRIFKERAEKFLSEHGLSDYFRKAFIHSNNGDL